jgi:hypothetical protein
MIKTCISVSITVDETTLTASLDRYDEQPHPAHSDARVTTAAVETLTDLILRAQRGLVPQS